MGDYESKEFRLAGFEKTPLKLYVAPDRLFVPTAVTTRFSRAIRDHNPDGLKGAVADIGTGVGPLAIWAAQLWDVQVHAVDTVEEHIRACQTNAAMYSLENKVHVYEGSLFDPFRDTDMKFEAILGDVSALADKASRACGWYPENVPTGGYDGTEVMCKFLEESPKYLAREGQVYFPVSPELSDSKKIIAQAEKRFKKVVPLLGEKRQVFTLNETQYEALLAAYPEGLPEYMTLGKKGSRHIWTGQFYAALEPRD